MIIIRRMDGPRTVPRLLAADLRRALASSAVVVVMGARQAGKSTLCADIAAGGERTFHAFDQHKLVAEIRRDPEAYFGGTGRLTLDEVQRAPDLLLEVKRAVDRRRQPGRFLLTGSANLLLMRQVSDSLAGRAVYLTLWPLTRRERLGRGSAGAWPGLWEAPDADWRDLLAADDAPREDWRDVVRLGGFPWPALHEPDGVERSRWHGGYVQTYLERDVRDVSSLQSTADYRRFMQAVCLRVGSLLNQSEIGRDLSLPQSTIHRWLDLLELTYQLVRLPAYSVNRTKRLVKSPKLYWVDTALAMQLEEHVEPRGAHLENLVVLDARAWAGTMPDGPRLHYWRTSTGEEVDLVIEWRNRLLPVEVKTSERLRPEDARGLLTFRREYGARARTGLLLHAGEQVEWLAEGVLAVPWWKVV